MTGSNQKNTCLDRFFKKNNIVITIDGPAGAGKSTLARGLSKRLKILYLDTGAMYRALTLACINSHVNFLDSRAILKVARRSSVKVVQRPAKGADIYLNSRLVSRQIRTCLVTTLVSFVARQKEVRRILVRLQRKIASRQSCVVEGRDIGTVVFPKAFLKFYLDASLNERADRRYKEFAQKNVEIRPEENKRALHTRDMNDMRRKHGPLKKAKDAVYIDSTDYSIRGVLDLMIKALQEKIKLYE